MASGYGRRVRVDLQKWLIGSTTGGTPAAAGTTCLAALCYIASPGTTLDDGSANATPGTTEPGIGTNGYSRQTLTWNATVSTPSNDAAAINQNTGAITFTSSGGAFTTAANALNYVFLYLSSATSSTTEANYIGRAVIAVPQAVNAAGITLTIASGGLTMSMVSA